MAASPVAVLLAVTFFQLSRGWSPLSDDAVLALRAWDVLSKTTPLLGQATLASGPHGRTIYDLGPLYSFLLSLPVHASPSFGPLLGSASISFAAACTFVAAARSAYALTGLFGASACLLLIEWQVPAVITDPLWNPHAAVLWFLSALAALLAVIEGVHRWYAFATFAASLAVQANIVFLVPVLVLWIVGTASLASSARSDRGAAMRSLATGAVVGVLCWVPTAVQEATGRLGNVSAWIWYLSHHVSVGLAFGLQSIAAMVDPRVMFAAVRSHSIVITSTFIAQESPVVGIVALCALVFLAAWSCHRGRPEHRVLGATVLIVLSMAYTFANMAPDTLASVDYLSVALVALASVLWVLLILAAVSVVPGLAGPMGRAELRPLPYVFLAAAVAMLLPRVVGVADAGANQGARSVVNEASSYIEERVPRGPVVVAVAVRGPRSTEGYADYADMAGVVWDLRVAGWQPEVYGALWRVFGTGYSVRPGAYVAIAHASRSGDRLRTVTVERPSS